MFENECRIITEKIYELKGDFLGDIFKVLFNTGLRRDELRCLKKSDIKNIDTDYATIRIEEKILPDGQLWEPKTPNSTRNIPIFEQIYDIIDYRLYNNKQSEFLFSLSGKNTPVSPDFMRKNLMIVLKELDMKEPGYTVHTTRHSFATIIANKPGVSLPAVQKLLGHELIETTMQYVHTTDQSLNFAIQQINV